MKRLILLTAYCLLLTSMAAQSLSEQKIIQKMTASAEAIRTVKCNFTQKKQSKMLKGEQISEGKNIEISCFQFDKVLTALIQKSSPGKLNVDYSYSNEEIERQLEERPMYLRQLDLIQASDEEKQEAAINFILEDRHIYKWIEDQDISRADYDSYKESILKV